MSHLQTRIPPDRRKSFIRKAALIFICIIILLTFFSKTINNFLLPAVETVNYHSGTLEKEVVSEGQLLPLSTETIISYGKWKIRELRVKEGDSVEKGGILAIIDADDQELELKRLELNILKLKNDLKVYKNNSDYEELDSYKEDMELAGKSLEKSEKKLEDQKALYSMDAVALESVKDAEEAVEAARRDYANKQKLLGQKEMDLKKEVENRLATVQQKELEIEVAELELSNLKENLPLKGVLKSPVKGTVSDLSVENGSTVLSGQVLFEILKANGGYCVKWTLNSAAAGQVDKGDSVALMLSEPENMEFTAIVTQKKYSAELGSYEYSADLKIQEGQAEPGQKVEVRVKKSSKQYPMLVPNSCIFQESGEKCVYLLKTKEGVMGEENYVQRVKVNVSQSDDFESAIEGAGISAEDQLVAASSKALSNGIQVKLRQ